MNDDFAQRRRRARLAFGALAVALAATLALRHDERQMWTAGVAVLALLILRGSWRCPNCGRPPSPVPWGHPAQCVRCGRDLRG